MDFKSLSPQLKLHFEFNFSQSIPNRYVYTNTNITFLQWNNYIEVLFINLSHNTSHLKTKFVHLYMPTKCIIAHMRRHPTYPIFPYRKNNCPTYRKKNHNYLKLYEKYDFINDFSMSHWNIIFPINHIWLTGNHCVYLWYTMWWFIYAWWND